MRYEWEPLFAPQILKRGRGYYDEGAVKDLHRTDLYGKNRCDADGTAEADVSGTRIYHVKIIFEGGRISAMECGCPYAQKGLNCKHMAAVLYELERMCDGLSRGDVVRLMAEERDSAFLQKLLEASLPELRDFLRVEAKRNEELKHRFLARCLANDKNVSAKLRREVFRISCSCFGTPGTEGEACASERPGETWKAVNSGMPGAAGEAAEKMSVYVENLCSLLDLFVPVLLEQRNGAAAFDLVCVAAKQTGNLTEYSENSPTAEVAACCRKHWNRILEHAFEAQRQEMMQWFYDNRLYAMKPSWNFLIREFLPEQEDLRSIAEKLDLIESFAVEMSDLSEYIRKDRKDKR